MGATETSITDEQVVFFQDRETGLRSMTVLDSKISGPTVGVCRRRPYDDEQRALADALRQARSTAAKAAMAGLSVGGGCTVLLNDPEASPNPARFQALGRAVDDFSGRYILMPAPEDSADDMGEVASMTPHVLGTSDHHVARSAMATALGVVHAIELAARLKLDCASLSGLRVAIFGLGPSGYRLAEQLRLQGAKIVVADRDPRRTERAVRELGIACVATEEIIHLDTDVFAPCASKDAISDDTLPHLRCSIVAGTADDVLASPAHGQALHERGILYAPDFIITAGGLISLVEPLAGVGPSSPQVEVKAEAKAITDRLAVIFDQAMREGRPTSEVAEEQLRACRSNSERSGYLKGLALAG